MTSVITKVQDILKESADFDSQFYREYKKFDLMYQKLLNIGVVSKRESQLLSIIDKVAIASVHFNRVELK